MKIHFESSINPCNRISDSLSIHNISMNHLHSPHLPIILPNISSV